MKHKDYYNDQYIQDFSEKLASVMPYFDSEMFSRNLIGQLEDKELFARFDCIVDAMQQSIGDDYSKNVKVFYDMLGPELKKQKECSILVGGYGLLVDMLKDMEMKTGNYLYHF